MWFPKKPKIGAEYVLDLGPYSNPFINPPHSVIVTDVKNGWVKYKIIQPPIAEAFTAKTEDYLTVTDFNICYTKNGH